MWYSYYLSTHEYFQLGTFPTGLDLSLAVFAFELACLYSFDSIAITFDFSQFDLDFFLFGRDQESKTKARKSNQRGHRIQELLFAPFCFFVIALILIVLLLSYLVRSSLIVASR